jgi:hypothetical protein
MIAILSGSIVNTKGVYTCLANQFTQYITVGIRAGIRESTTCPRSMLTTRGPGRRTGVGSTVRAEAATGGA